MRSSKAVFQLDQLPHHIVHDVLDLLDGRSLACLMSVSKFWKSVVCSSDERSWSRWKRLIQGGISKAKLKLHEAYVELEGVSVEHLADFWKSSVASYHHESKMKWWSRGRDLLEQSLSQISSDTSQESESEASKCSRSTLPNPMEINLPASSFEKFARSGHTATEMGDLVVVIGGLSKEQEALGDVVIVDLARMSVFWPEVEFAQGCPAFPRRLRHTANVLQSDLSGDEQSILIIGGHDLERECECDYLFKLTVLQGGQRVQWSQVKCTGEVPSPRYHHTSVVFGNGKKLALFGGGPNVFDYVLEEEIDDLTDTSELNVAIFVLDLDTLEWTRSATHGENPGIRTLHMACHYCCDKTQRDKMVVIGGFRRGEIMPVDMIPYVLDLESMEWHAETQVLENLPCPRHRGSSTKIASDKLLIYGGALLGTYQYLSDAHVLNLKTCRWSPVELIGEPGISPTAGHTMAGNIVIGGSIVGNQGIIPAARIDPLVFGHWRRPGNKNFNLNLNPSELGPDEFVP